MARLQPPSNGCAIVGVAISAHHRILKELLQHMLVLYSET